MATVEENTQALIQYITEKNDEEIQRMVIEKIEVDVNSEEFVKVLVENVINEDDDNIFEIIYAILGPDYKIEEESLLMLSTIPKTGYIFQFLMEQEVDINYITSKGDNVFHYVYKNHKKRDPRLKILFTEGIDMEQINEDGISPTTICVELVFKKGRW